MTNNNGTSGIRISQPVYMFTVLLAGVVALLVISTSLTHTEVVRPHPTPIPIDPFANVTYTTYSSPDGTFQVDYPSAWEARAVPNTPLVSEFSPGSSDTQTGIRIFFTALRAMQSLPTDTSPAGFIKQAMQPDTPITPLELTGGFKGSCGTGELDLTDSTKGKAELCVVSLDGDHLVAIQGITHSDQWSRMEPVMERLKSSLQIKVESVAAQITTLLGSPTAQATAAATTEATAAATSEATQAATSEATQAATSEATSAVNSEATAAATVEATAAATVEATAAATTEATSAATSEATQAATAEATPVQ